MEINLCRALDAKHCRIINEVRDEREGGER